MLLLLVCITGIGLGLYFNVLVLLPVALIGSAILFFCSSGLSPYASLGDVVFPLILAQAGYMLGLTGRGAYGYIQARFQATQSNRV